MNDSWLKRSVMLRMTIIGGLTFAMLVPSVLIMGLISEREQTRTNAIAEVSEKWGTRQTLAGPMLTLPFKRNIRTENGGTRTVIEHARLLPAMLAISATVSPEVRYRGIYQVTLYNAIADLRGTFSLEGLGALNIKTEDVLWEEASLTFGISDLKGVKEAVNVRWNNRVFPAEPGVGTDNALRSGINIKPMLSFGQADHEFAVSVNLNGSEQLEFVPVGKVTNVTVSSPWTSPSFVGRFLPDERMVRETGFDAKWNVLDLNRNFPQQWISERLSGDAEQVQLDRFTFGVKLITPADQYHQMFRSAKYAIMFIVLTFLAFFLTEILTKRVGHPIQYALIGFALVLFYCLLLSLSEHLSFVTAYLISSAAIVALIGGYSRSVLGTNRFAATISLLLGLLYAFLFVILQAEDYALLFGSMGLFAVLALVMYLTRRIDWYSVGKSEGIL